MTATIRVRQLASGDPLEFDVTVSEDRGETRHRVTMARADHERLAPGVSSERLVEAAFRFLLNREPKEAIMARFDLTVIPRYFPEFEARLPGYLAGGPAG